MQSSSWLIRPAQLSGDPILCSKLRARNDKLAVRALTDKGQSVRSSDILVRSPVGEGSYGQVFEGYLVHPMGRERIILKRIKERVEGALEMGAMEHLLNVYASKATKNSIAKFVGYAQVLPGEATRTLTEGLWLLWQYEGNRTLSHYMRRRDCIQCLAEDLKLPEEAVVPTVMQHVFESVAALHSAGLVHRDVKPLNIIFAEEQRRFKLIDLGACADLRTGTNYIPDESILDPVYAPPEQYCMPTDSPHLARKLRPLAVAMSPMLWTRYKPDRFDSFSCGLVLVQLTIPKLRTAASIKSFNSQLKRYDYDLLAWRDNARLSARDTVLLDANNGAGWDLASALLRPRKIQVDDNGGVSFSDFGGAVRMPVTAALRHPFMKETRQSRCGPLALRPFLKAVGLAKLGGKQGTGSSKRRAPTPIVPPEYQPSSREEGGGLVAGALSFWKAAARQLRDLDDKLVNQGEAVEYQTGQVVAYQQKYARGEVSKQQLDRQENLLGKMTNRLNQLQGDFNATAANAQRVLGFLNPREKFSRQAEAVAIQQTRVQKLKAEGRVAEASRQETLLSKMAGRLGGLQEELNSKAADALGFLQKRSEAGQPVNLSGNGSTSASMAQNRSTSRQPEAASRQAEATNRGRGRFPFFRTSSNVEAAPSQAAEPSISAPASGNFWNRRRSSRAAVSPVIVEEAKPRSAREQAAGAAVTGIYAGLKLTGLALRVATDVASSLGKEAERALAASEAARAEQRRTASARKAFLQLLGNTQPVLQPESTWEELRPLLSADPRFGEDVLDDTRRMALFEDYTAELRTAREFRLRRGEETFKELLNDIGLTSSSEWLSVRAQLQTNPRFVQLPSGVPQERIFGEAMTSLAPKFAFNDLLNERQGRLSQDTTWGEARQQFADDHRFDALPERERRAIFRKYIASLSPPVLSPMVYSAELSDQEGEPGVTEEFEARESVAASMQSLSSLRALRAEQAKLKAEYDRMEAKLAEMEKQMLQEEESPVDEQMNTRHW